MRHLRNGIATNQMEDFSMSKLVPPHGGKGLVCCLLEGAALEEELKRLPA